MSEIDTTTPGRDGEIEIEGFRFKQAAYPFRQGVKLLGLATSTAYLLMKRGELFTFTWGGRRYISAAEIVRVILKNGHAREDTVPRPRPGERLTKREAVEA